MSCELNRHALCALRNALDPLNPGTLGPLFTSLLTHEADETKTLLFTRILIQILTAPVAQVDRAPDS
jgi:hypothetical protein